MPAKKGFTTRNLHADREGGPEHGVLHKPVHHSVAFGYGDARELAEVFQGKRAGYAYGRQANPTVAALQQRISAMEDGIASVAFSTGMAAITALTLTLLKAGDHMVSSAFLFGNTNSYFRTLARLGIAVDFVDATHASAVAEKIRPETRLVFVETIANPVTQIADLEGIGALCRERGLLYVVDNTMTSPHLYQPKSAHAGLVVNSLTKYIGGHGNALGGAITDTGCFDWNGFPNILDLYRKGDSREWGLLQIRKKGLRDMGATLAPDAAHTLAVGSETLSLRLDQACANAMALARLCADHPAVATVNYPGLPGHPQHQRARKLFRAFGALFSIELAAGIDCFDFLNSLEVVVASSNLGDTRSLGIPVAHTIYHEMGPQWRQSMGIADSLLRFSIGIEDQADLLADFSQALDRCRT